MNEKVSIFLKNGKEIVLNNYVNVSYFYRGKTIEINNLVDFAGLTDEILKFNCKSYYIIIGRDEISCVKLPSSLFCGE